MSASIWFIVWAIRRRAEVDENLDRSATVLRWVIVAVGYIVASLPVNGIGWLQVIAFVVGLLFLCWPNFAYDTMRLVRRSAEPRGRAA
jgi:hypothetical protein